MSLQDLQALVQSVAAMDNHRKTESGGSCQLGIESLHLGIGVGRLPIKVDAAFAYCHILLVTATQFLENRREGGTPVLAYFGGMQPHGHPHFFRSRLPQPFHRLYALQVDIRCNHGAYSGSTCSFHGSKLPCQRFGRLLRFGIGAHIQVSVCIYHQWSRVAALSANELKNSRALSSISMQAMFRRASAA